MTDKLEIRRRITLWQFTLELQMRAAQPVDTPSTKPALLPAAPSENAFACQVALGLAKRRADQ
jgi:hypothetical protein